MLSGLEKILFIALCIASGLLTYYGVRRVVRIIASGQGKPDWPAAVGRVIWALVRTITLRPTFRTRPLPSITHALVAWGFMFYVLVNLGDVMQAFIPGFIFLGEGWIGQIYRLCADLFSVGVLIGLVYLLARRFVLRPESLRARPSIYIHPNARRGIQRDSAIVGAFIFLHVGGRFLGQSFSIAASGGVDAWQPFASGVASLWKSYSPASLVTAEHVSFWFALGLILLFLPYFPYSKHIHIFFAPLNFTLKPIRRSIGELSVLDFENDQIDQFGASKMEHLGWEQLLDAYACIMCFRCQDVCPPYQTGKVLSPAALEINKRYLFNEECGNRLASGNSSDVSLTEGVMPEEAVWACTSCGACVDICPVGNEPMRDILDIRRGLVLMDNTFPEPFKAAYRGMERSGNPWNIAPQERMKWAAGLSVPTISQNPDPEILWWVGCAPSTDSRAQKTAQAFARILQAAGVSFAVLGEEERCTGDAARRSGKEDIFYELAQANVELLNEVRPKRIVTTCPHCMHVLMNEYPVFGGHYNVVHSTQFIEELVNEGRLLLSKDHDRQITYHDPCYLARHNGILASPRTLIVTAGHTLVETEPHGVDAFCCGAGGAQMWKEESEGEQRINERRFYQAADSGAAALITACPFCLTMLTDAAKILNRPLEVQDMAEMILERLQPSGTDQ